MSAVLSRLTTPPGSRHSEKRVGRGNGTSLGKTCGRGQKGQKARNGGNIGKLHFQGGQTPIQRRLPKRGFRVPFPIVTVEIKLAELERFDAGTEVTEEVLREARLIQGHVKPRIKVLGGGELTKKLTVSAHQFTKGALEKIEKAGGKVVTIEQKASDQAAES
jgi:large subunit ribosomal protein L15